MCTAKSLTSQRRYVHSFHLLWPRSLSSAWLSLSLSCFYLRFLILSRSVSVFACLFVCLSVCLFLSLNFVSISIADSASVSFRLCLYVCCLFLSHFVSISISDYVSVGLLPYFPVSLSLSHPPHPQLSHTYYERKPIQKVLQEKAVGRSSSGFSMCLPIHRSLASASGDNI